MPHRLSSASNSSLPGVGSPSTSAAPVASSPTVSLICTVRDEADTIADLLDSMLAQSRLPDEIVVNDCGSRDATAVIVQSYAARDARIRLVRGGYNIPSGRNHAIAAARGTLIACTDAGLVLDRDWLARIIAPLEQEPHAADLVGGFYSPAPRSIFELALGATNYPDAEEIVAERFLPSGNSMAFRKHVWEAVGGFPEWADHCEDLIFDQQVIRAGYRWVFVPDARVWFRPRESLIAFARQYFFYARGDGVAHLWGLRHAIRYATYFTTATMLLVSWRYPKMRGWLALLLAVGAGCYTFAPYRRLLARSRGYPWYQRLYAIALVPIIRVVGDCAKMIGYPVGCLRRMTYRNLPRR